MFKKINKWINDNTVLLIGFGGIIGSLYSYDLVRNYIDENN